MKKLQIIGLCLAVLLGAYLLFTLEPLVGKLVTPGFGGTITIWSGCMLFFQVALLAGYGLAYGLTRMPIKMQIVLYAVLLVVSIFFSKPPGLDSWICNDIDNPALSLVIALTQRLALPFIVLSSISIMMQTWYQRLRLGNPYPLYSVSNIGSILALLAYPIILEPNLTLDNTAHLWSAGYVALVAIILLMSVNVLRHGKGTQDEANISDKSDPDSAEAGDAGDASDTPDAPDTSDASAKSKPTLKSLIYWCFLSAAGSLTLLAFTTYITQDIAPIPLLWVLPLATYLMTFIILFGNPSVYLRRMYSFVAMSLWFGELFISRDDFVVLAVVNLLLLFFMCMVFHGELVKSRPNPKFLPTFYVSMAFGGAIGGIFVNFIAPVLFTFYVERQLSVLLLVGLIAGLVVTKNFRSADLSAMRTRMLSQLGEVGALVMGALSLVLCAVPFFVRTNVIAEQRNFYSSIQIERGIVDGVEAISMVHGRVIHGIEFVNAKGDKTAGLYWEPVALAFDFARSKAAANQAQKQTADPKQTTDPSQTADPTQSADPKLTAAPAPIPNQVPLKCGIVGLGVGFNALFGEPGDLLRYYELDPKVKTLAEQYFSYLKKSKAKVEFEIGDGRSLLAREKSQQFDLIIIDAFNGDAIPVHLLTLEAGQIYLKHLKPNGVLMIHASNRFLKLPPVVGRLAQKLGFNAATVRVASSTYIILSRDPHLVDELKALYQTKKDKYRSVTIEATGADECPRAWTDDYVNLFPFLQNAETVEKQSAGAK